MAEPGKRKSVRSKGPGVNLDTLGLEMGNRPPQALDVEEAVLGALLIEPNCIDEAMDELTSSCFYSDKHKMVFNAMRSLTNEHVALDILSVTQKLKSKEIWRLSAERSPLRSCHRKSVRPRISSII